MRVRTSNYFVNKAHIVAQASDLFSVMNWGPMKPFISNMFRSYKTLDMITLFHKPSVPASTRVANILKQLSAQASETATEDQASDHTAQNKAVKREPFDTEITEEPPTPDQLKSIFQALGGSSFSQIVKGASSESDALRKIQENPDAFQRPVLVDWNQGKAVAGDNESQILKLLKEQPK